jgi:hypothetical protein
MGGERQKAAQKGKVPGYVLHGKRYTVQNQQKPCAVVGLF